MKAGANIKRAFFIWLLVFLLPVSASCGRSEAQETRRLFAMDTFMELKAYGPSAGKTLDEAEAYLASLGGLLSVTDECSDIWAVNHAEGAETAVSQETFDITAAALEISRELGEPFELTVYPVLRAWGFTASEYRIPEEAELEELLRLVDDEAVKLDMANRTIRLPRGAELDLGAAAKGWAADACAAIMRENGVTSALLNLGSSTIYALGRKPEGSDWSIAVKDPFNTEELAGKLAVHDMAVSTSGGYERYFEGEDGEIYWHIIDSATGRPAKAGFVSVTVISANAFTGDCLSTALFVMGPDRALEYWRAHGGFEFIAVTEEGELLVTPGAAEIFTPLGAYEGKVRTIGG